MKIENRYKIYRISNQSYILDTETDSILFSCDTKSNFSFDNLTTIVDMANRYVKIYRTACIENF